MLIEQLLLKQEAGEGGATVAIISFDDGNLKIRAVDISDPSSLSDLGTGTTSYNLDSQILAFEGVAVDSVNQVAYVSGDAQQFLSFDISDPNSIGSAIDNIDVGAGTTGGGIALDVAGSYAYTVGFDNDSIHSIDISAPSSLVEDDELKTSNINDPVAIALDVANGYAYLAGFAGNRVSAVDISDPTAMSYVSNVTSTADLEDASGIAIDLTNNYVYVSAYTDDCITAVDISTPASLSITGTLSNSNLDRATDIDIDVDNQVAYVVSENQDSNCRITSIDISTPASMTQLGTLSLESVGSSKPKIRIDTIAQVAYVLYEGSSDVTLKSVDISTPSSMTVLDTLVFSGVTAHGDIDLYFPQ